MSVVVAVVAQKLDEKRVFVAPPSVYVELGARVADLVNVVDGSGSGRMA